MKKQRPEHGAKQAVALNYDQESAPRVSAKGEGSVAEEILRIAEECGVHVHEDANLVRFLSQLELGMEIPRELFLAVAEVIAFAYVLKGKFPAGTTEADYTQGASGAS